MMRIDVNPFDELNDAALAIKDVCNRISGPTLFLVEDVLKKIRDVITSIHTKAETDFLPVAGMTLDEIRQRVAQAEKTLDNMEAITSHLRQHEWLEIDVKGEHSAYEIRLRLKPKEE